MKLLKKVGRLINIRIRRSIVSINVAAIEEALKSECCLFTLDAAGVDLHKYGCWREDASQLVSCAKKIARRYRCKLVVRGDVKTDIRLHFFAGIGQVANFSIHIVHADESEGEIKFRSKNMYSRRIKTEDFMRIYDQEKKHASLRNLYSYPIDAECNFDVDFVFTWVNHQDLAWRELISKYKDTSEIEWDRYVSVDELRFSLRAIAKFAPWVRKIHVVTNCAPPEWYIDHPQLEFVSHEAVFGVEHAHLLPTFNSHAIEACLANVPGLSEHFVYFNDDFFLARPASKASFFASNGCSISYMEGYGMVVGDVDPLKPDYMNAAINGRQVIEHFFQRSPTQLHRHVPYALRVSTLKEIESRLSDEFYRVRSARFRTIEDLSLPSFLYHHYAYQSGTAVRDICNSILINAENYKSKFYELLENYRIDFFCINDGNNSAENDKYMLEKISFLMAMYPEYAPWERIE